MNNDIYQGITKKIYDFYNSNKNSSFIILLDKKDDHFLTLPFIDLEQEFYKQKSIYFKKIKENLKSPWIWPPSFRRL
jgi:hypothetical protein